jgi:hypothetical protein
MYEAVVFKHRYADAERLFAKQINATTISLPSSHASPLSHPNEVAQLILDAANKLTGEGK